MPEDRDIPELSKIHNEPSVKKFISISGNYFDYVTATNGVTYYKILCDGILTGGIHIEKADGTMYISICTDEKYRGKGIAAAALNQLFSTEAKDVKLAEVSIDIDNTSSISLFEKLGFRQTAKENELIIYHKILP